MVATVTVEIGTSSPPLRIHYSLYNTVDMEIVHSV